MGTIPLGPGMLIYVWLFMFYKIYSSTSLGSRVRGWEKSRKELKKKRKKEKKEEKEEEKKARETRADKQRRDRAEIQRTWKKSGGPALEEKVVKKKKKKSRARRLARDEAAYFAYARDALKWQDFVARAGGVQKASDLRDRFETIERVRLIGFWSTIASMFLLWEIRQMPSYDHTETGLEKIFEFDLSSSIESLTLHYDLGLPTMTFHLLLWFTAPLIFPLTAFLSARITLRDWYVGRRVYDRVYLLFFATVIITNMIAVRADQHYHEITDWGIGFWLAGLSGIALAFPDKVVAAEVWKWPVLIIGDIWKGFKDPWAFFLYHVFDGWGPQPSGAEKPDVFASKEDAHFPLIYYTVTIVTWVYSATLMIGLVLLLLIFVLIFVFIGG